MPLLPGASNGGIADKPSGTNWHRTASFEVDTADRPSTADPRGLNVPRPPAPGSGRIPDLDGLRGVAAMSVLLYHYTTCYQSFKGDLPFSFQYGVYGVQLFFILSGFVILMTVERRNSPSEFVRSRLIRLYPAFWISVAIAFSILALATGPSPFLGWGRLLRRTIANLTMVQGWFHIGPINGAYWTLGLEMTFYVIVLCLLVVKKLEWIVPTLCGVVAFGVLDGLCVRHWPNGVSPWLRSALALDYIQYMLIGVLIYRMRERVRPADLVLIVLCLLVPYSQDPRYHELEPGKEFVVGGLISIVVAAATARRIPILRSRPLVFLGTISYSLYLNHSVVGTHIIYHAQERGASPTASIALATVTSLALATFITFYLERPAMDCLRRRLEPREKAAGFGKPSLESPALAPAT